MLIKIHRKLVFIHDTYIFACIMNYSLLKNIITYFTHGISRREGNKEIKDELLFFLKDKELLRLLDTSFYKKLGSSEKNLVNLKNFLEKLKLYPSMEYSVRIFKHDFLRELASRELVWIIPYNSIKKLAHRKTKDREYIEIIYSCPLIGRTRIFRTYYDSIIYAKIKQLCLFNGNENC